MGNQPVFSEKQLAWIVWFSCDHRSKLTKFQDLAQIKK